MASPKLRPICRFVEFSCKYFAARVRMVGHRIMITVTYQDYPRDRTRCYQHTHRGRSGSFLRRLTGLLCYKKTSSITSLSKSSPLTHLPDISTTCPNTQYRRRLCIFSTSKTSTELTAVVVYLHLPQHSQSQLTENFSNRSTILALIVLFSHHTFQCLLSPSIGIPRTQWGLNLKSERATKPEPD